MGVFEMLEHTADVGLRAFGSTIEEAFEAATEGLASIVGAWKPGPGEEEAIAVEGARDLAGVLVEWLSEVLYLQDRRDAVIRGVEMDAVSDDGARGRVRWGPRGDAVLEGTAVKAITYHELLVERRGDGWVAEVYVDV